MADRIREKQIIENASSAFFMFMFHDCSLHLNFIQCVVFKVKIFTLNKNRAIRACWFVLDGKAKKVHVSARSWIAWWHQSLLVHYSGHVRQKQEVMFFVLLKKTQMVSCFFVCIRLFSTMHCFTTTFHSAGQFFNPFVKKLNGIALSWKTSTV